MIKQLYKEFIKYFIVGGSGVFLDIGLLVFFAEVLSIIPWVAVAITQIIALSYNFALNKFWSFRNTAMPHAQMVKYLILAGINYLFSVKIMFIFNEKLEYPYIWVRIATIAVMVLWNFVLYKHWVFKGEKIEEVN